MCQNNTFFVTMIALCTVSAITASGDSSTDPKELVTQIPALENKIYFEKKFDKAEDYETAEAREPSSSYGHGTGYGHGGGHGHGGGGGYGGGHGKGYGGGGHGAITLDPVSIISLLALGAFLINNILQLLRANARPIVTTVATTGRRLVDSPELALPVDISYFAEGRTSDDSGESASFSEFFQNVGSLYYLNPKKRNICIKKVVCSYIGVQRRESTGGTLKGKIFDIMVSTISTLVAPEIVKDSPDGGECDKLNKLCSDTILRDAKITAETKIYGTLASMASKFAFSSFLYG